MTLCLYHKRAGIDRPASDIIDGEPMCLDCIAGKPISWRDVPSNEKELDRRQSVREYSRKWRIAHKKRNQVS